VTILISVKKITGTVDEAGAATTAQRVGLLEVTNLCRMIMNQATVNAPVDKGILRGQHAMSVSTTRSKVTGKVVNRAKYAAAVHDGSKPHIIRARKKKALRFEVNGKVIFRRSVRHPGTSGRPWLVEAAQSVAAREGWRFKRTVV